MAKIAETARRQINDLKNDFRQKQRPEAIWNLRQAIIAAEAAVDDPNTRYRTYPATYTSLSRPGVRWINLRVYWISYKRSKGEMVITNVF